MFRHEVLKNKDKTYAVCLIERKYFVTTNIYTAIDCLPVKDVAEEMVSVLNRTLQTGKEIILSGQAIG